MLAVAQCLCTNSVDSAKATFIDLEAHIFISLLKEFFQTDGWMDSLARNLGGLFCFGKEEEGLSDWGTGK